MVLRDSPVNALSCLSLKNLCDIVVLLECFLNLPLQFQAFLEANQRDSVRIWPNLGYSVKNPHLSQNRPI